MTRLAIACLLLCACGDFDTEPDEPDADEPASEWCVIEDYPAAGRYDGICLSTTTCGGARACDSQCAGEWVDRMCLVEVTYRCGTPPPTPRDCWEVVP